MQDITLNSGGKMPTLGLGVYQIPPGKDTESAVITAIELGYRLFDTAAFYKNERSVGEAIRKSGVSRSEIFITTKLHPLSTINIEKAFDASLRALGSDYIDLYLIHWPFLGRNRIWRILNRIHQKGDVRAIGVSNFRKRDIEALDGVVPAINQVEFHPFLYRKNLLDYSRSKGIVLEAHSPLTHGTRIADHRIQQIASKYGKSAAQILIRWSLQHGLVVIPKTTSRVQMLENVSVFDFLIKEEDMATLDALNENRHIAGLSRIIGDPA